MAISFTYCGAASSRSAPSLFKATGARVDVADGAASSALAAAGFYRIVASTSSYVLISTTATNGTGGEHFPAGHAEVRFLTIGDKIGCSAGA